jgi:cytochrome c oxidase subunit 2
MNSLLSLKKYLGLPVDASSTGGGVDNLIFWVHALMLLLFVGWLGYFILVLVKFNHRAHPKADHAGVKNHSSTYLEGLVALIEAVLLIGLAIPLWAHAVEAFPPSKNPKDVTTIKVIAAQFNWHGWYPGANGEFARQDKQFVSADNTYGLDKKDPNYKSNFIVANELVVPVDKPVVAYITSMDVIHCFAIRPMRVTQDAIPVMSIPAWFTPHQVGTYQINCAQLCGISHFLMRGTLKVVSQQDYDKWVAKNSSAGAGAGGGYE